MNVLTDRWMDPLAPFVYYRRLAPYATHSGRVMAAHSKSGFGAARTGAIAHRIEALAVIFYNGAAQFGARWLCSGGTVQAVPLADAEPYGGACKRCNEARWPVVYRCLDADGQSLYIGSSSQYSARMSLHRKESSWRPDVAEVACEQFEDITQARLAERLAIQSEHPLHNIRYRVEAA